MTALFVDSWGWIVLANQKEEAFENVKSFYQRELEAGRRIVTTDYVLDEVTTFLFAKAPSQMAVKYVKELLASIGAGRIRLERIGADRFDAAWKMRLKYHDQPKISFTDFASFVVMREIPAKRVLTNDRHFEQVNLGFQKFP